MKKKIKSAEYFKRMVETNKHVQVNNVKGMGQTDTNV